MGALMKALQNLGRKLTGQEIKKYDLISKTIDDIADKYPEGVVPVTANPEGEATEDLSKLGINGTVYGITGGGSNVTINDNIPFASTVANSITVNNSKYRVQKFRHNIIIRSTSSSGTFVVFSTVLETVDGTAFTKDTLTSYLNSHTTSTTGYPASGTLHSGTTKIPVIGICAHSNSSGSDYIGIILDNSATQYWDIKLTSDTNGTLTDLVE